MSNSNKHMNPDIYRLYCLENTVCELAFELDIEFPDGRNFPHVWEHGILQCAGTSIDAADAHHIFGGNPRYDLKTNLISVARRPHDLYHFGAKGQVRPLKVLFLLCKARKAERIGDHSEFDIDKLNFLAGDRVGNPSRCRGHIESLEFDPGWEWVEEYRDELVDRLRAAEESVTRQS